MYGAEPHRRHCVIRGRFWQQHRPHCGGACGHFQEQPESSVRCHAAAGGDDGDSVHDERSMGPSMGVGQNRAECPAGGKLLYGVDSEPALDAQAFLAYVAGAGLGLWHVAEPLLVSLLALRDEKLGPAHPATQATATYYLDLLLRNNRFRTAENVLRRLLPRALIHQRQLLQQQAQPAASGSTNAAAVAASGSSSLVSAFAAHRAGGAAKEGKRPCIVTASAAPSSPLPLLELQHRLEELKRANTPTSAAAAAVAAPPMPGMASAVRGGIEGSASKGELATPMQTAMMQPKVVATAIPQSAPAELLEERTPTTGSAAATPPAAAASPADATAAIIATPAATAPLLAAEATAAASKMKPLKGTSVVAVATDAAETATVAETAAARSRSPDPAAGALPQPAVATTTATALPNDHCKEDSCGRFGHRVSIPQEVRAPQAPVSVIVPALAEPVPQAATAQVAAVAVAGDVLAGAQARGSLVETTTVQAQPREAAAAATAGEKPKVAAMASTAALETKVAAAATATALPDAAPMVAVTGGTGTTAAGQPRVSGAMMASEDEPLEVSETASEVVAAAGPTAIVPPRRRETISPTALPSLAAATAAMEPQQSKSQQQQPSAAPSRGLLGALSLRNAALPAWNDQKSAQGDVGVPAAPVADAPAGRPQTHQLAFRRAAAALRMSAEAMDDAGALALGRKHTGGSSGGAGGDAAVATNDAAKGAMVTADTTATAVAAAVAVAEVTTIAGPCRQIHEQPTAPDAAPVAAVLSPLKRTSLKAVAASFKAGLAASPTSAVARTSSRTRSPSIRAVASSSPVCTGVREDSEPAVTRATRTLQDVSEQMDSRLTGIIADAGAHATVTATTAASAAAQTLLAAVQVKSGAVVTAHAVVDGKTEAPADEDVSKEGFKKPEAARGTEAAAQAEAAKAEVVMKAEVKATAEMEAEVKAEALVKAAVEAEAAMVQAATAPDARVAAAEAVKLDINETFQATTTGAVTTSRPSRMATTAPAPLVTEVQSTATSSSSVHGVDLGPAAPLDQPPQSQPSNEQSPPLTCRIPLPPRRRLELAFEQESDECRTGPRSVLPAQQPVPPQRSSQSPVQPEGEAETRPQLPKPQQSPKEPEMRADTASKLRSGPPANVSAVPGEEATMSPHEQLAREPVVASDDVVAPCAARSRSISLAGPASTEYDAGGDAAEQPIRGSVSPCDGPGSAIITIQAPTGYDADADKAEQLSCGSVSPAEAPAVSGSPVITTKAPTEDDAGGDAAKQPTRGSVSPAHGPGSAVITIQAPTGYDADADKAEQPIRGSVSPCDGPGSAIITVQAPIESDADADADKAEQPIRGSVSSCDGPGSAIITVQAPIEYDAGGHAAKQSTHGSVSPAHGPGSAVITIQAPTGYDAADDEAEQPIRGSVSPCDGPGSAIITVQAPIESDADADADADKAEQPIRGSVSPCDGPGSAIITIKAPTGYDADADKAKQLSCGSVSPAEAPAVSGSPVITTKAPTEDDASGDAAKRSTRGSVSPAEAPAVSVSPVITISVLEWHDTEDSGIKDATRGSVSSAKAPAGSGSPITTVPAGDEAVVRLTHGSVSPGDTSTCGNRTANLVLPPPSAAYRVEGEFHVRWESQPLGVLELAAEPHMSQSAVVGFELHMRPAQSSTPVAVESSASPPASAKTTPPLLAAGSTMRQLDTSVESAAVPSLHQSLVLPLHSCPFSKEQQQQLPAPSLVASISALLAAVTPFASPAPMTSPSGCRTSPPSPLPFHIENTSAGSAVTSTAAPPPANVGRNPIRSEITCMKDIVQYYEETEDTDEEGGGQLQPLQLSEGLQPPSLLDQHASTLSSQSSTAITAAVASPPALESLLALDNLPSPLQPRPSSMDFSAPVPLQPLPLEPLPYMQDPLPSMQLPLLAAPGMMAVDSPAMSWTSVGAAVPPVGAPEEISAGVRVCPDTDISLIHVRSLCGYGLRRLEVERGAVLARDGGDKTCHSYSSSPLAMGESPLGMAAVMAAEASAPDAGQRAAGNIVVAGMKDGVQPPWKGSESLRQHVVGLGPVPRPSDAQRLRRLPPPGQKKLPGWQTGIQQPTVAVALEAPTAVAAAAVYHQQRFRSTGSCNLSATNCAEFGFPLSNPRINVTRRRTAEPFEVEFDDSVSTAGQQQQPLPHMPDPTEMEWGLGMSGGCASVGIASVGTHSTRWEGLEDVEEDLGRENEEWLGSAEETEQGRSVEVVEAGESSESVRESEGVGSMAGRAEEDQHEELEEGEWCGAVDEAEEGEEYEEGEWCGVLEEEKEEEQQGEWKWEEAWQEGEEEGEWCGGEAEEEGEWEKDAEEPQLGTAMAVWGAAVVVTAGGAAPDEKPATASAATERLRLR
ncbi:hypothetical protein Vretifemale_10619 [Volvox reticuliferus]|uniref:Uncharacterized protein n=1 Tax=Volvox reticuliferus TaxID=1737510 RepID=A0A8J4CH46_9CHLO|nr:hypothetical protein Vretifemale_10619 [Volvox reticuliferus]